MERGSWRHAIAHLLAVNAAGCTPASECSEVGYHAALTSRKGAERAQGFVPLLQVVVVARSAVARPRRLLIGLDSLCDAAVDGA